MPIIECRTNWYCWQTAYLQWTANLCVGSAIEFEGHLSKYWEFDSRRAYRQWPILEWCRIDDTEWRIVPIVRKIIKVWKGIVWGLGKFLFFRNYSINIDRLEKWFLWYFVIDCPITEYKPLCWNMAQRKRQFPIELHQNYQVFHAFEMTVFVRCLKLILYFCLKGLECVAGQIWWNDYV